MAGDPRSTQTTLGVLGLVLVLLAGFAVLPRVFKPRQPDSVGHEAPDFELALVANAKALGGAKADAKLLRLSELRGNAVLLDFWATWCGPCRAEAPIVDRLSHRWQGRGLVVVGVNTDTADQGDPHEFALSHGLTYPIVHDIEGRASRLFAVDSLPTIVVVSPEGEVTAVRSGVTSDAELERLVRQALKVEGDVLGASGTK
jgi:cytochrome c biogenesis protein CcmG, thiol:disulfide interchange protein DsbE